MSAPTPASLASFTVAMFIHDIYKHAIWYFLHLICFLLLLPLNYFFPRRYASVQALSS